MTVLKRYIKWNLLPFWHQLRTGPNQSATKSFLQSYFTQLQRALKPRWREDTSEFNFSIWNPRFFPICLNLILHFFPCTRLVLKN